MFTLGATRWRDYGVVGDGPRLVRVDFACGCRVHHWATEAGRIDPLPCCSHSAELGLPLRGHGCGGPSELGFQLDLGEVARAAFTDPDPKEQAKLNPRLAELARAIVVGAACDEPEQACGEELLGLSSWVVEPASDREGRADQLIAVAEAIASPESRAAAAPVPVVESLVARRTRRMLAEREPHGERFWRRKEALALDGTRRGLHR